VSRSWQAADISCAVAGSRSWLLGIGLQGSKPDNTTTVWQIEVLLIRLLELGQADIAHVVGSGDAE
jgi:hypothetical protein